METLDIVLCLDGPFGVEQGDDQGPGDAERVVVELEQGARVVVEVEVTGLEGKGGGACLVVRRASEADHFGAEADRLMGEVGRIYRSDPGRAAELMAKVVALRRKEENRAGLAEALNWSAVISEALGRREEALSRFEDVLAIRREVGDRVLEEAVLFNLARLHWQEGHRERALLLFHRVAKMTEWLREHAGSMESRAAFAGSVASRYEWLARAEFETSLSGQLSVVSGEGAARSYEAFQAGQSRAMRRRKRGTEQRPSSRFAPAPTETDCCGCATSMRGSPRRTARSSSYRAARPRRGQERGGTSW